MPIERRRFAAKKADVSKTRKPGVARQLTPAQRAASDKRIIRLFTTKNWSMARIGRLEGISEEAVRLRLKKHGITALHGGPNALDKKIKLIIGGLRAQGRTSREIHQELRARKIRLSLEAVRSRVDRLPPAIREEARKQRVLRRDATHVAKTDLLRELNVFVPRESTLPAFHSIRPRHETLKDEQGVEVTSLAPLKLRRKTARRKIKAIERLGVDWKLTTEHQDMLGNGLNRIRSSRKAVKKIGLYPELHYLLKFDLARDVKVFRRKKYAEVRRAIKKGDEEPILEFVRNLALQKARGMLNERVNEKSPLGRDLTQQAMELWFDTVRLTRDHKADPAATLAVVSRRIFRAVKEQVKDFLTVYVGARELEFRDTPGARRTLARQLKQAA